MTTNDLRDRLVYEIPHTTRVKTALDFLSDSIASCGEDIQKTLPDSRESTMAMSKLEEAFFWATAGITRHQEHYSPELAMKP